MFLSVMVLALVALASVILGLIWRFGSQRRSIPCPVWLGWMVEMDNPFTRTNRAAVILRHARLQPGMEVLDAGCGPGRLSIPAARQVGERGRVVALDLQPGMLARVREKAGAAGLQNIEYLQAGLGEGKTDRNRFDLVLLVTVLGEIPDAMAALKEIFEALRPGGTLSVTEVIFDPHFQRRKTVEALAGAAGFRERAFFGHSLAYTVHFEKPMEIPIAGQEKT